MGESVDTVSHFDTITITIMVSVMNDVVLALQ